MKTVNRICMFIIILLVLAFGSVRTFLFRVELGEVGVRTQEYGIFGKKGVIPKDHAPGWHRRIPVIDSWKVFDSTVQTLEFAPKTERVRTQRWRQMLRRNATTISGTEQVELKSDDGYTVNLDVTIKYRIKPGMAFRVFQDSGSGQAYKGLVQTAADNTFRSTFGAMKTEEFYSPLVRREKTELAMKVLQAELEDRFVEVIGILVRDITFDPAYERKILDKKLADQDVQLNISKAEAARKRGETNKIMAETEAIVKVIQQEMEAALVTMKAEAEREVAQITANANLQAARTKADADLYAAELEAKGTLLEKEAEAEGESLRAAALQGSGGANLVALEAAKGLQLGDVTISTLQTDFLDVEMMAKKLGSSAK